MGVYIDSKYGVGLPRWERARINALIDPDSAGAKLYRKRTSLAEPFAGILDTRPYAFHFAGANAPKVEYRVCSEYCAALELQLTDPYEDTVTVMSISDAILDADHGGFMRKGHAGEYLAVSTSRPTRDAKCRVCWSVIRPDGTVTERTDTHPVLEELWAKEAEFLKLHGAQLLLPEPEPLVALTGVVSPSEVTAQAWQANVPSLYTIDDQGNITALENVMIVRLTSGEREILQQYCTPEHRVDYGQDHTLHLNPDAFTTP